MKVIKPSFEILTPINEEEILKLIEVSGRTCYKSEDSITNDSSKKFVKMLIDRGHDAMIEHFNITVKIICDRGVTHEIVRHRIASYAQESTRYCNYNNTKFGNELTVIEPCFWTKNSGHYKCWLDAMQQAEDHYNAMILEGATPQEARSVLPNSLKTEIVVTMNIREWRHFFKLRTAKTAHPQMREIAIKILNSFKNLMPTLFNDVEAVE